MIVSTFNSLLFSVYSTSLTKYGLYASIMLSIYAKLSRPLLAARKRERLYMLGTVFNLVRLKIVPTIKNHCQCVVELSSLVCIKLQRPFTDSN